MKNGCTLAALIGAMLNIINEVATATDRVHIWIDVLLALVTLVAIWRIDVKKNHHGERR